MKYWIFDKISMVANITFDHILQDFYSFGVKGLVRENIQNSLGARISDDIPVRVTIRTGTHKKDIIPGFDQLEKRIKNLNAGNEYTLNIINNMHSELNRRTYNYITFEDENTKGLAHSSNGSDIFSSSYASYAYGKGSHYEDEEDMKRAQGGSHGIGKIASNSASIFNIMFFANCDANNRKTLGGTIELIEHSLDDQHYRGKGYFTNLNSENEFVPFDNIGFDKLFEKNTRGLKVIVPFVYDEFIDEEEIIRTVCDTFFDAILKGKLEVNINDLIITKETIHNFVYNSKYFDLKFDQMKDYFTPLYMKTMSSVKPQQINIPSNDHNYSFTLWIIPNNDIKNGRTAIIRRIGMKIEDHKVRGLYKSPYNAVLLCNTEVEDNFLVSLENVSHTQLSYSRFTNREDKENAKRFLSQLDAKLAEVISEVIKNKEEVTFDINTEEILNHHENKFEQDLRKRMSVINVGSGTENKKIVKIDDTDEEGKGGKVTHGGKQSVKVKRVKKKFGTDGYKYYYQVKNSAIYRLVKSQKETIVVDLSGDNNFNDETKCNLLFTLIDGRGVEHYDILNLRKIYRKIEDNNSFKKLEYSGFTIRDVNIKNGHIKLSLYLHERLMNNKYRIYLED